ncbi:MAG: hypothetical protein U1E65_26270 [Myxococcota bacterium]
MERHDTVLSPVEHDLAFAVARLREAFRRCWSWAVSERPQLARIGQEHLLERIDFVLRFVRDERELDPSSPLARLWAVRNGPHVGYPLGTRRLFATDLPNGYWDAAQSLFRAMGMPPVSTFDGPFAHHTGRREDRSSARTTFERGLPVPMARELRTIDP